MRDWRWYLGAILVSIPLGVASVEISDAIVDSCPAMFESGYGP